MCALGWCRQRRLRAYCCWGGAHCVNCCRCGCRRHRAQMLWAKQAVSQLLHVLLSEPSYDLLLSHLDALFDSAIGRLLVQQYPRADVRPTFKASRPASTATATSAGTHPARAAQQHGHPQSQTPARAQSATIGGRAGSAAGGSSASSASAAAAAAAGVQQIPAMVGGVPHVLIPVEDVLAGKVQFVAGGNGTRRPSTSSTPAKSPLGRAGSAASGAAGPKTSSPLAARGPSVTVAAAKPTTPGSAFTGTGFGGGSASAPSASDEYQFTGFTSTAAFTSGAGSSASPGGSEGVSRKAGTAQVSSPAAGFGSPASSHKSGGEVEFSFNIDADSEGDRDKDSSPAVVTKPATTTNTTPTADDGVADRWQRNRADRRLCVLQLVATGLGQWQQGQRCQCRQPGRLPRLLQPVAQQ